MDNKKTYVAPSADVLFTFGNFILGSNDLPGDVFGDGTKSTALDEI